jgi:hypothetical protein
MRSHITPTQQLPSRRRAVSNPKQKVTWCEDLKIANKKGATTQPADKHNEIATRSGREISGTNQQRGIVAASQTSKTNKYHEEHGGLTLTLLSPPRKPIGHGFYAWEVVRSPVAYMREADRLVPQHTYDETK